MSRLDAPVMGEMLAGRYRLDEAISDIDAWGRALWKGTDTLLDRPIAVELQIPGGIDAAEMIETAIAASSIEHPGVAGVYDAVNEPARAYVIREWVNGEPLSLLLAQGPINPTRAAGITRDIADAVAAIHSTGSAHGALTPDCVYLSPEGDVTLTNLSLRPEVPLERDIRSVGGLLYAALTGHWPLELGAQATLPDAVRSSHGICSPRQVRAGIPSYLDALTMDLLDPTVAAPTASDLAGELYRYDVADPGLSALSSFVPEPPARKTFWRRFVIPIGAVASIVIAGVIVGTRGLPHFNTPEYPISGNPGSERASITAQKISPVDASILDPDGDGSELDDAELIIDGDPTTVWATDGYRSKDFGGIKPGMGVLIDLGSSQDIQTVAADFTTGGATIQLRTATEASGSPEDYNLVAQAADAPSSLTFTLEEPVLARYVLLWITTLPSHTSGQFSFSVGVGEVIVAADKQE